MPTRAEVEALAVAQALDLVNQLSDGQVERLEGLRLALLSPYEDDQYCAGRVTARVPADRASIVQAFENLPPGQFPRVAVALDEVVRDITERRARERERRVQNVQLHITGGVNAEALHRIMTDEVRRALDTTIQPMTLPDIPVVRAPTIEADLLALHLEQQAVSAQTIYEALGLPRELLEDVPREPTVEPRTVWDHLNDEDEDP